MPFLEHLDQRRRFDTIVTLGAIGGSLIFAAVVFFSSLSFAGAERKKIYVLSGNIPLTADQTDRSVSFAIEAKAHVRRFHELFFTLAPDEKYIQHNIERAMYLIDESGIVQYNTLKERGFYNNLISASAQFSIITDSIRLDDETGKFIYWGRQRIERRSSILYRSLETEGIVETTMRTENNPHGLIIRNYRTVANRDLEYKEKTRF